MAAESQPIAISLEGNNSESEDMKSTEKQNQENLESEKSKEQSRLEASPSLTSVFTITTIQGDTETIRGKLRNVRKYSGVIRLVVMGVCWLISTYGLFMTSDNEYETVTFSVPAGAEGFKYKVRNLPGNTSLLLRLYGPFIKDTFKFDDLNPKNKSSTLAVKLESVDTDGSIQVLQSVFHLNLAQQPTLEMVEKIMENLKLGDHFYQLHFLSNLNETLPLQVAYEFTKMSKKTGLILALVLLILIYMTFIFDMVHRTVAGVVCSTLAIGIISAIYLRPSQGVIFAEWGSINNVMVFFGVSIIIELLSDTGLSDYLAAITFEIANGHIWPMLHWVLFPSCLLSNLFDQVLLMLFIAPICLRLCEIMQLNCTPVLTALIIAINVGSTFTPISSFTNNLILDSPFLPKARIENGEFVAHMLPISLLVLAQSYIHIRLKFRNSEKMRTFEPSNVVRLKRLIKVWHKASLGMGDYTWDDSLVRKTMDRQVISLSNRLRRLGRMPEKPRGFEQTVRHLRNNYRIKNQYRLIICLLAIFLTFVLSVVARLSDHCEISKGWSAILGALLALSLTSYEDIEGLLARIDWSTMLFVVTLSIIMEVLIIFGLLDNIGLIVEYSIISVDASKRLTVAILLTIWITAILTTFIDNVPVLDMMMRIIGTLSLNEDINMPIMPLVWSLALGSTLGTNGSIVGGVTNIACAGVASRHGYNLTFLSYFKIGFFVMLGNVTLASCYLLLVHVVFEWQ